MRMELAAALHHSSFRGAGPESYDAPRSQMTANSREDSVCFDLYDEDTEVARPDRLAGVRPQERDQRHTVEQIVDTVLFVPSLDVPVPQMENQLVEVCRQLDVHIPEQVIEVPKISSPSRPCQRRVRFAEQTAEQLVEVPTIISYSSLLQRTVEQNVDIPVLAWRANFWSSRFSSQTEFYSSAFSGTHFRADCGAERRFSCWWRPPRFSPSPGFFSVFFEFS